MVLVDGEPVPAPQEILQHGGDHELEPAGVRVATMGGGKLEEHVATEARDHRELTGGGWSPMRPWLGAGGSLPPSSSHKGVCWPDVFGKSQRYVRVRG